MIAPMEVGLLLAAVVLWLVPVALVVYALVDAVRRPSVNWAAADQNQTMWVIIILSGALLPFVGPIVYLIAARPKLKAAA